MIFIHLDSLWAEKEAGSFSLFPSSSFIVLIKMSQFVKKFSFEILKL